jgi:hypothetical protein
VKAIARDRYGQADDLVLRDTAQPSVGAGEVLDYTRDEIDRDGALRRRHRHRGQQIRYLAQGHPAGKVAAAS